MEPLGSDMDRISELPVFIVHHILSLIDPWTWNENDNGGHDRNLELVRMSVLSKKWFHLVASFPILDLSMDNFTRGLRVSQQTFFKYVEYATSRFCHQNVIAHKFKLSAHFGGRAELEFLEKCIESVLKNGVRELEIYMSEFSFVFDNPIRRYRLPNIPLSNSVLKSLSLSWCEWTPSLMVKSLSELRLVNVTIDDEMIKCLTASCPLLQQLKIGGCHGLKNFCVYGHQNLQEVGISYTTPVERIDIEAPNLYALAVVDEDGRGAPVMNLASCKKLTTVSYRGNPLPNSNGFTDFLSNFTFIENFCLVTEYECSLKLSSDSLRTLVLLSKNCDMKEFDFSFPNLVAFHYFCNGSIYWHPACDVWRLVKQSTRVKGSMHCYLDNYDDTIWFQNLRLFLEKKNGFKVSNLCIDAFVSPKITEFRKLREIELPPYELENIVLKPFFHGGSPPDPVAFMDAVLWCCRPRSLTIESSYTYDFKEVAKFTYEKLLEQEDEGCAKIRIVPPSSPETPKDLKELMSLSEPLLTVTFMKEEVGSKI